MALEHWFGRNTSANFLHYEQPTIFLLKRIQQNSSTFPILISSSLSSLNLFVSLAWTNMQNVPTISLKKGLRFSLLQVLLGFDN
jgi:hypothetical protein